METIASGMIDKSQRSNIEAALKSRALGKAESVT